MKTLSLLLLYTCGMICTGLAQAPASSSEIRYHTPAPSYPENARKAKLTGSGTCQVIFDASGHVEKIVMAKSTGSPILDDNTLDFARKNWTGKPNTRVLIPIVYLFSKPAKSSIHVFTPMPPYPYQARANHAEGRGIVKVTFDETGHAVSAAMTTSTGSGILDGNTVNYALKEWKTSGGEKKTISVPVAYRIQ